MLLTVTRMSRDFLHPDDSIEKHGSQLPHWKQGEVIQFVTFRLGDALPNETVVAWKKASDLWRTTWPPPWTADQQAEYHQKFTVKLERWLDQGMGSCLLRLAENREILEDVLMHFEGERVQHHSWVIMPNHVHLLFKPLVAIEELIQAWKSVSARRIGQGSIWQANYRDTLIRDGDHFANAVRYIRRNPRRLSEGIYTL